MSRNMSSYRTYEEWKPIVWGMGGAVFSSSYRTYEEWKLIQDVYLFYSLYVLTVPMRNGNSVYAAFWSAFVVKFLPYL